jgi:sterol desaturase/sphingolipid hydroxylase (fatty acid hydroxylase superfamily)
MFETLTEYLTSIIKDGDTYLFLFPIYGALIFGERVAHELLTNRRWDNFDAAANIFLTLTTFAINLVVGQLLPLALFAWLFFNLRFFTLGDGAFGWFMTFLLYDLCWYIDHRIGHRVGLFWAMHQVHHSSEEYNMTVASRGFVFDITFLSRPMFYLLPLVGVSPFQFIVVIIFSNIWGIAQHTRLVNKLGWLDWLIATPSNHRVHHGCDEKYLDKNYGEVLMIWDHLFGTYQAEEEDPKYGVVHQINTYNPIKIQVLGVQRLLTKLRETKHWQDKLRCLYRPPGWEPPQTSGTRKHRS